MYNNGGNIFNSDIEKLFRYNNIKNVINNSSTDKIHRAINRYQYFFGSQNDITINNNQSIILKNTNDKNHKRLTKKDVESDKIRKALEILNKNNFFNESKDTTAKSLHEKTIQLQYKNMKNIHSNTSLTELEKNYNNLLKVREKGGYIIGFDTETIGGLNNRVWSPDMITEFGFKIDDLTKNTTKDINVLISSEFNANTGKISHQEKLKQIEAILSSENGLEKLKKDNDLMISAMRYSIYGDDRTKIEFNKSLGYAQVTSFAGEEAAKIGSIEQIRKGVKKLTQFSKSVETDVQTGLKKDVSEIIKTISFMSRETRVGNAMAVNFNGQVFDIPVMNKFIKDVFSEQEYILKNRSKFTKSDILNAQKAYNYMVKNLGANPTININPNYTFDAFSAVRTAIDMYGENTVYNGTTIGKDILSMAGTKIYAQENIANAFYHNLINTGTTHKAIDDTRVLNAFFTKDMENSSINSSLIDWLMTGINGGGIMTSIKDRPSTFIKSNQLFMANSSSNYTGDGRKLLNYIEDSKGRIITSSGYILENGKLTFDEINGEYVGLTKNQFYKINGIKQIDVSSLPKQFANIMPEYSSNSLYKVNLEQVHGSKYADVFPNKSLNIVFGSRKEAEAWISSNLTLFGESNENGIFNMNIPEIQHTLGRLNKHNNFSINTLTTKESPTKTIDYIMNTLEDEIIDRRVTNGILHNEKAGLRIAGVLDFHNYLKKNNYENISSVDLNRIYFNGVGNGELSINQIKNIKDHLLQYVGYSPYDKKTRKYKKDEKILYDATARNALFAYENISKQDDYYSKILNSIFEKMNIKYDPKKGYADSINNLSDKDRNMFYFMFDNLLEQTNSYIANTLDSKDVNTRKFILNGINQQTFEADIKSKYDFKLSDSFYSSKKSKKINHLNSPLNENIITFDLNKENPRRAFLKSLMKEKYEFSNNLTPAQQLVYGRAAIYDFITNMQKDKYLRNDPNFRMIEETIKKNPKDFSIDSVLQLLQNSVENIKDKHIDAGILRNNRVNTRHISKKIADLKNNISEQTVNDILNNMPMVIDINHAKKDIDNTINKLLKTYYVPSEKDLVNQLTSKSKSQVDIKMAKILRKNVNEQMKGALTEIFQAAGYVGMNIHINKITGDINLVKDNISIPLTNFPKIKLQDGMMYVRDGQQNFKLEHVIRVVKNAGDEQVIATTNLDMKFGKENYFYNKIKNSYDSDNFSPETFVRQFGFTKREFAESPTIQNFTLADMITGNSTVNLRNADPIFSELFNPGGSYRHIIDKLYKEGKLNTPDLMNILEEHLPEVLKSGDLSPILRMLTNSDVSTILQAISGNSDTTYILKHMSSLGKETRIAEGKRSSGYGILGNALNLIDNYSKPTLVSSLNAKWIKSNTIEEAQKTYGGLLIKGHAISSEDIMKNIYTSLGAAKDEYLYSFSHRQLYTGVLNVGEILQRRQEQVLNSFINPNMIDEEKAAIKRLYSKTSSMIKDSLYEQAKILDPKLLESVYGNIAQDVQRIGNSLNIIDALTSISNNSMELKKIADDTKLLEMMNSIGSVKIDQNGFISYKKGKGSIVKRGELIAPYITYGGTIDNISSKFNRGVLSFNIRDMNGNELSIDEINKILNENKELFSKEDRNDNIKNLVSLFRENNYRVGFEIENINKSELVKMSDNSAEKSMVRLFYGKTGEFDSRIRDYFERTNGEDLLYSTVLTDKAIDAYVSDVKKNLGANKSNKILEKSGFKTIEELKEAIKIEQMTYREMIFGEKGIFNNVSSIANDTLIKHRNEGARLMSTIGQAISLVGKYQNNGIDNYESYKKGLDIVTDLINSDLDKYSFIRETSNNNLQISNLKKYTSSDFSLLFDRLVNSNEFNYVDTDKLRNLIKDINDKYLKDAKEEDKLYHTNVKVLTDRDTYENIEEYYGSLSFIKDKDGNKYAVGSTGIVATTFNIDSESQSSLSKEYLDRRAHIRKLEEQIETYKKSPNLSIDDLSVIDDLNAQLQKEIAITNSMKSYSAGMKIDDQAKNILSLSKLNETTENSINARLNSSSQRDNFINLLGEASSGLLREENGELKISPLVRSDNVNAPILNEIRQQITFNPLTEKLLTEEMVNTEKYAKYKSLYEQAQSMGLKLGTDHAQLFYEGKQAYIAAEFNNSNKHSLDDLVDKYHFDYKNIEEYIPSLGRVDNPALQGIIHDATIFDLGEEFGDSRFFAVPGLGRQTGGEEIRQPWHQSLAYISRLYDEYSSFEGLENKESLAIKNKILDVVEDLKTQTNQIIKKGNIFGDLGKVEVNMPYNRVKLLSTMNESLLNTPLNNKIHSASTIEDLYDQSFKNKAIINGKTIAEWEKGGVDEASLFFDYRTASISQFDNAGYFNPEFMKKMGFEDYVDSTGKKITAKSQMMDYLETYGTMDIVDRYPNIKDTSLYTGRVFLDRNMADNATAVSTSALLKINGDSDGDMISTLMLEYKGTNYAYYNKARMEAEKQIRLENKLTDAKMSDTLEARIKNTVIQNTQGKISSSAYDFYRGKEIETIYNAYTNNDIVLNELLPSLFKESERNYKNMAISILKEGKQTNLLSEVVDGKSILGKVRLFAPEEHVKSGFFVENNKKLSEYMQMAYSYATDNNIDLSDYKYIPKMKESITIHDFKNKQSEAMDEILSILEKAKNDKNSEINEGIYNEAEKTIFNRIRANTYIEAEMSKSGKEAIGQVNAALYPLRQSSELYFGNTNPRMRKIISDMSEQIEQNIISYKHEKVEVGDTRLIQFVDIMRDVKKVGKFDIYSNGTEERLHTWTSTYLSSSVADKMYENLKNNDLLTEQMIEAKDNIAKSLISKGHSEKEANSLANIHVITEEYIKGVNELYQKDKPHIELFSNFGRRGGTVTRSRHLDMLDDDSFSTTISKLLASSEIGEKSVPLHDYQNLNNTTDSIKRLNDFARNLTAPKEESVGRKIAQETLESLGEVKGSSLAMGVLGLASGLLISGFAGGNPLNNANPEEIEKNSDTPKTQAMSVPEFFNNQGGYVTGNSQNGYIINIKADTNKGDRHMKRALKEAVKATAGNAVSINMNFKSNNNGGYSDKDIENLISKYI